MARYVVLSFEDNEEAESFIERVSCYQHEATCNCMQPDHEGEHCDCDPQEPVQVVSMLAQPTQFCDGNCYKEKDGRGPKFVQGQKYGWWVCTVCHKPLPHPALYRPVIAYGTNLLPEEVVQEQGIEERKGGLMPFDPGWGRYRGQRLFPREAERMREPYLRGSQRWGRFAFELSLT